MCRFGAASQTTLPNWPIYQEIGQNKLKWQCCLAGSCKTHTGIFAQNSFQIDSINSCNNSKKTAILTKNCQNYSFFNTKTNKGDIGLYFGNIEKNC